jgi:hypothetical protein
MTADDPYLDEHRKMWSAFVKATVAGTAVAILIVAGMAIFLV